MHREFRKALDAAEGHSEFIIVVVVDIRGFSEFSKRHESPDTAMYIKRVYMHLIDDYFNTASFYKSTGDGLLVTIPYTESTLKEVASSTIETCLKLSKEFAHICDEDPMINFETPKMIGIGIARGTACCLKSNNLVLDYSGHILNLAARLMSIARPSGIVIDGDFIIELLDQKVQDLFEEKETYLRSIAEETPKTVYILKNVVNIPPEYLQPLKREQWESIEEEKTIKEWKEFIPLFRVDLKSYLRRPDTIRTTIVYPKEGKGSLASRPIINYDFGEFKYREIAGQACVIIDIKKLLGFCASERLPQNRKVKLRIEYIPKIIK